MVVVIGSGPAGVACAEALLGRGADVTLLDAGIELEPLLGRPHGFRRVHAVDASIFPSIPSTTITFSVMANAHRIGSEDA